MVKHKTNVIGSVISIADGIITASGLSNCCIGELVEFVVGYNVGLTRGFVMNLEKTIVKIVLLQGSQTNIYNGQLIKKVGHFLKVRVGFHLLGSLITPFGVLLNAADQTSAVRVFSSLPWFDYIDIMVDAPTLLERMPITRPFITGTAIIDSFLPIGCGQRELIIGDHNTGKTSLALTAILSQRLTLNGYQKIWRSFESNMKSESVLLGTYNPCIFVSIGKRRSEASRIKRVLKAHGALKYTCMVFTGADDNAGAQFMAPYVGSAIGEWFRSLSYHAVIVYDDLSSHAVAYRQISLLLRRPPGREAFPGDIFYVHSRLLERAAQLKSTLGGGSLTALPIIETKGGDVSGYIPTNVISITDGQIFLSMSILNSGIRPAVDLGLSVSRVGSNAQGSFMKEIAKKAKRDYSLYKRYVRLTKVTTNLGSYIKSCINRGSQLIEFFKQRLYVVLSIPQQVLGLFAICNGYLDNVPTTHIKLYFSMIFNKCFPCDEQIFSLYSNIVTNIAALDAHYTWELAVTHYNDMHTFFAAYKTYFTDYVNL